MGSTDVVYQFCRESPHAALITSSHGRYVGAASRPFSEYRRKPGDRLGQHWRMPATQGRRSVRYVLFDTNHWKSFIYSRLATPTGDPGSLTLFGHDAQRHRLFAEHLTAEYRIRTTGRGRELDEWRPRPNTPDNQWLDAVVGCAVAASMQGVAILGGGTSDFIAQRQRISFAELQRSKRR